MECLCKWFLVSIELCKAIATALTFTHPNFSMGIYIKLPAELNEVDVIVAGGALLSLAYNVTVSKIIHKWLSRLRRRWAPRRGRPRPVNPGY